MRIEVSEGFADKGGVGMPGMTGVETGVLWPEAVELGDATLGD